MSWTPSSLGGVDRPLALALQPLKMGGLLGAIAADCHAAPAARAPSRMIGEHQHATRAFARFDIGKIFLADELRQVFGDWQQQGFRRSPVPRRMQFEAVAGPVMGGMDLAENL